MRKICCIGLLLVMVLVGCSKQIADVPVVDVTILDTHFVKKTVTFEGVIQAANNDTMITTELLDYPVKSVNVKVGEWVEPGEIICVLDIKGKKLRENQSEEVIAPTSGIVSEIYITAGLCPSDERVAAITNTDNLCAKIWIDEEWISIVQEGQSATIVSSEMKEIESFGSVDWISQIKEEEGFLANIPLEKKVPFKIGMDVTVTIDINVWKDVLAVDKMVVQKDEKGYFIFVAERFSDEEYIIKRRDIYSVFDGDNLMVIDLSDAEQGEYVVSDPEGYVSGERVLINITEDESE